MMERRLLLSRRNAAMPTSPNFCAAMGPRKRVREMSARIKVAVLIAFALRFSPWPSGDLFAQEKGGTMLLYISSSAFLAGQAIPKIFTCYGLDVSVPSN